MTRILTGIVTQKPSQNSPYLMCRIGDTDMPVRVACVRAVLATAVVGDQILITGEGRQLWATNVLGWVPATPATGSTDGRGVILPERSDYLNGTDGLTAVWSGTWDGASWRPDSDAMVCGSEGDRSIKQGAAFFGAGLTGYGTLTRAVLSLSRLIGGTGVQTVPVRLLAGDGSMPAVYPTVLDTVNGPTLAVGQQADWTLPDQWLDELGPGGDAGGIGVGNNTTDPYMRLARPRLTFDWRQA